jgi:hypothetical protein
LIKHGKKKSTELSLFVPQMGQTLEFINVPTVICLDAQVSSSCRKLYSYPSLACTGGILRRISIYDN